MTRYQCRDCGHPYGETAPSAPVIALHRAVSHSGKSPIVESRGAVPRRAATLPGRPGLIFALSGAVVPRSAGLRWVPVAVLS